MSRLKAVLSTHPHRDLIHSKHPRSVIVMDCTGRSPTEGGCPKAAMGIESVTTINRSISSCTFLLTGRTSSDSEGR